MRDRHALRSNDCKRTGPGRNSCRSTIATITPISLSVGANRVVEGVSIPHPTGHVELTKEKEKQERAKQIHLALDALSENIQEQKVFEEGETL